MVAANFTQNLLSVQTELHHFAYKLTADREDANDLLQETSLKALYNMEKYADETNFKGWMYTIMRNIFINNYRKTLRDQTYVDKTDDQYYLNKQWDIEGDSLESGYDMKEMRRIVNALPKEYRQPFSMYVAGFKYREDPQGFHFGEIGQVEAIICVDNIQTTVALDAVHAEKMHRLIIHTHQVADVRSFFGENKHAMCRGCRDEAGIQQIKIVSRNIVLHIGI